MTRIITTLLILAVIAAAGYVAGYHGVMQGCGGQF